MATGDTHAAISWKASRMPSSPTRSARATERMEASTSANTLMTPAAKSARCAALCAQDRSGNPCRLSGSESGLRQKTATERKQKAPMLFEDRGDKSPHIESWSIVATPFISCDNPLELSYVMFLK